jgi:anti-sigma factor RsiW
MIPRLDRLSTRFGHVRPSTLSRYLEGDLKSSDRLAVETHLGGCADCRAELDSMTGTVRALGSLRPDRRSDLADSIIAALRASTSSQPAARARSSRPSGSRALMAVPDPGALTVEPASTDPRASSLGRGVRALLAYCLHRPQLRFTLPLAFIVGVALSLINQGYMIFSGRVDLGMCAICGLNFVIPFLALNVGLLLASRVAARRRP